MWKWKNKQKKQQPGSVATEKAANCTVLIRPVNYSKVDKMITEW